MSVYIYNPPVIPQTKQTKQKKAGIDGLDIKEPYHQQSIQKLDSRDGRGRSSVWDLGLRGNFIYLNRPFLGRVLPCRTSKCCTHCSRVTSRSASTSTTTQWRRSPTPGCSVPIRKKTMATTNQQVGTCNDGVHERQSILTKHMLGVRLLTAMQFYIFKYASAHMHLCACYCIRSTARWGYLKTAPLWQWCVC